MLHPEWATWLRILLTLHITGGVVAFVCAPVALATAKGAGRIGSGTKSTSGRWRWSPRPLWFSRSRCRSFPRYGRGVQLLLGITALSGFLLPLMGFIQPHLMGVGVIHVAGHAMSIVSVVVGAIGMRMGLGSIYGFLRPPKVKMFWWFEHLQGMIGSYIAAMTAFSSVNLSHWFGPAWWVWLWPTMAGVPAITIWTAYYQKKFAPKVR
jgi:hypothetical protein